MVPNLDIARNKTYKDQYHFTDDTKDTGKENPSIEKEPSINTTIKENPYRSNVEIEGNEIVLQPDLTALFKAVGKRHGKGGMDVLLKPNSFIFSDFKDLAINEKERELFELKDGGKFSTNTPAQVLKKNVDVKHYNTLVEILDNPYKDDLAKKSSARMLEKYIGTLGNVAYIQESKKGFPDGVPEFAMNTAPVYDPTLKADIEANKQYMKAGGNVNPKAQWGNYRAYFPYAQPQPKLKYDTGTGRGGSGNIYNSGPGRGGSGYNLGVNPVVPSVARPISGVPFIDPVAPPNIDTINNEIPDIHTDTSGAPLSGPQVEDLKITPQGAKRADWEFTPWQKLSRLHDLGQWANVKRYMPYRSRYTATYVDPALVNPEQAVGDMRTMANQQLSGINTLNPILRNAQASSSYAQLINQIPGVRSQYDNQNAAILNQSRQYNNQVKNNETMVNMANDQQYYTQAIEGRKNFDNMRQFLSNQAMSNTMKDVSTNQKLAWNLLTQNQPRYGFDWKSGQALSINPKDIRDVQGGSGADSYKELFDIISKISDPVQKATLLERVYRQKNILPYLQQLSTPQVFGEQRKGGKTKNPYRWK